MEYSNKQIDKLIVDIYNGKYSAEQLPEDLYVAIGKYLEKGVKRGFSKTGIEFTGTQKEILNELRENVWIFSGAKTYQTTRAMEALINEEGQVRTLKEFKEVARETYNLYNETWARTEYDTAIGQAQNAYAWSQFDADKDTLPLLRYSAVIDPNTSEICEPLDGITLPVDDPFWDTYMPLNHYNCRCLVEQLSEGDITGESEINAATQNAESEMADVFKTNPGKTREVFDKEHPYFTEIPDADRDWAKENFGLEIPDEE